MLVGNVCIRVNKVSDLIELLFGREQKTSSGDKYPKKDERKEQGMWELLLFYASWSGRDFLES